MEANPHDPSALADAAIFFSKTDVAGMAFVYGLMQRALEPAGPRGEEGRSGHALRDRKPH
jgi:hypothetical protein